MPCEEAWQHYPYHLETAWHILLRIHPMGFVSQSDPAVIRIHVESHRLVEIEE